MIMLNKYRIDVAWKLSWDRYHYTASFELYLDYDYILSSGFGIKKQNQIDLTAVFSHKLFVVKPILWQ